MDHSILLHRLSSGLVGYTGTALSEIESDFTFRSSYVSIKTYFFPVLSSIHQAFVFCPGYLYLLFTLYTSPLSAIISDYSISHRLVTGAHDTQLDTSLSTAGFDANIHFLEAIYYIYLKSLPGSLIFCRLIL
jgi:hypothetical protein